MNVQFLSSAKRQFRMYQGLGEKAIAQMSDDAVLWQANDDSNSVVTIVKHLRGNMLSRWTDFFTTDGEKPNRNRDEEFEPEDLTKEELLNKWQEGWERVFFVLDGLTDDDLDKIIHIRGEAHTVLEAINRQLCHYSYHVGQIVYIAKLTNASVWKSLSIPRNQSRAFNDEKFGKKP